MTKSKSSLVSPALRRAFFLWSRTIHIYVSSALFVALVFFSITGITLNHSSTFNDKQHSENELTLPRTVADSLTATGAVWPASLEVLNDFIKESYNLENPRSFSADADSQQIELDYPLPGGYAFIIVDVPGETIIVEREQGNAWALLNDLHKGRHTGEKWIWAMDISAVLMLLFAVTGLIILFQLPKRRKTGVWAVILGTATPILLYWLLVPAFSK